VLLGPVQLDDVTDIREEADVIIDADVGRPAARMGDVSGDGKTDLIFIRADGAGLNDAVITVIMGGDAGGIELPRSINRQWVIDVAAAPDQNRVRQLTLAGKGYLAAPENDLAALNWDDDSVDGHSHADLLISGNFMADFAVQAFVLDGNALWRGEDAAGNATFNSATDSLAVVVIDGWSLSDDLRTAVAGDFVAGTIADDAAPAWNVTAAVAGDVNGDGLDDVVFADAGYISFAGSPDLGDTVLPNIGRAYVVTGRPTPPVDKLVFLGSDSELIVQDFSLGGSVAALGDINFDGYDDFAVGRTQEGRQTASNDPTREGGLLIYFGKADWGSAHTVLRPADADITVRRDAAAAIPEGV
ncbi:MAG: integrin alpha, partial [Actinomycetota bacterium]